MPLVKDMLMGGIFTKEEEMETYANAFRMRSLVCQGEKCAPETGVLNGSTLHLHCLVGFLLLMVRRGGTL